MADHQFLEGRATACARAAGRCDDRREREDYLYLARIYQQQARQSQAASASRR